jgi:N-acetylmuramoyl-L-alanine amidase
MAAGMTRVHVLFALSVLVPAAAAAAPPVKKMYNDALAREEKVRAALNVSEPPATVVTEIHRVVAAYEAVVRRYPASGYSDNALWQAGRLELEAFAKFGDAADKDRGVRLLRRLAAGYPSSRLVQEVPEVLARLRAEAPPARQAAAADEHAKIATGTSGQSAPPAAAPTAAGPEAPARVATIKDIRRAVLPDAVRITIELDAEVPFHDERITDPERVFVDLPGTRPAPPLVDRTLRFSADADVVRQVRVGRHPNNTTRVVLDAGGVTSYSVYPLYAPFRLVIDCVRPQAVSAAGPQPKPFPSPAPPPLSLEVRTQPRNSSLSAAPPPAPIAPAALSARQLTATWPRRLPSSSARSTKLLVDARAALAPPPPPAVPSSVTAVASAALPALPPVTPAATVTSPAAVAKALEKTATPLSGLAAGGGLSIARQLGLGVSRIVIDAGHGGHDPGAKGKGVTEAELVLDVAVRLEKLLQKVPGTETILTRRTDDFVPLPERTAIANREGADLFLSIHANASPNPQAHGVETYFLNFANNVSAAAVAARENAASTLAMGEMPDIVKAIAMSNKVDESRDFATHVQRAMSERLRPSNKTLKDLGVKQAPFVVLIGATMPAVLAEISFVTNPQEARLLKSNAYRQKIAESLFNAIRKYQTSLKSATAVALQ